MLNVEKLNLVLHNQSCEDYFLYYDIKNDIALEVQFDKKGFNGIISIGYGIDSVELEWEEFEWSSMVEDNEHDKELYDYIKNKAINDYKLKFNN